MSDLLSNFQKKARDHSRVPMQVRPSRAYLQISSYERNSNLVERQRQRWLLVNHSVDARE